MRFAIREGGRTVGAGAVTKIINYKTKGPRGDPSSVLLTL